jgi:hypothetical protein
MLADNIHIVNPNAARVFGTAFMPGPGFLDFVIEPGQEAVISYAPGTVGGPVLVQATARVIASQRVEYYQSFNEVPAQPVAAATTTVYLTWYDHISDAGFASGSDNVFVFNPSGSAAMVTVTIPGFPACVVPATVPANGGELIFSCPTGFGGPIRVDSSNGVPVLASARVTYFRTFNEVVGQTPSAAQVTSYFTWFDRASSVGFRNDNIHVVNPSLSQASTVHVSIPGCSPADQSVPALGEAIFGCPFGQGFGGPVTVTSTNGVALVASQRVQFFQSFNEVTSMAPSAGAQTLYMPWYDHASSVGFVADNVHVINIGTSTVTASVTIPGCSPPSQVIGPGQLGIFGCPFGSGFGGPVVVQSTGAVLASQRVEFFQTFNEAAAQP